MRRFNKHIIPVFALIALLYTGCLPFEYESIDFLTVETLEVKNVKATSATLLGRAANPGQARLEAFGFCWSLANEEPTLADHILPGVSLNEDFFEARLMELTPGASVNIRSYAKIVGDDRVFYGETLGFLTENIALINEDVLNIESRKAVLVGRIFGLEEDLAASAHGFCWSDTSPFPTIEHDTTNLGLRTQNDIFVDTLAGLENGVVYYVRPYAIYQLDKPAVVYGSPQPLRIDDVWEVRSRVPPFRGRQQASVFVIDDRVYMTGGIVVQVNGAIPVFDDLAVYRPEADEWILETSVFVGVGRYSALGFAIGKKGYIGMGRLPNGELIRDFFEYDPNDPSASYGSVKPIAVPEAFQSRYGALTFVIDEQAYIGFGIGSDGRALGDLWRFDPSDPAEPWTPLRVPALSRAYASVFVIDDQAYIGTGFDGANTYYRDFWRFDVANKSWNRISDLPGPARAFAVGGAVKGKGYVGTGGNPTSIALNDFWEYDPQKDEWTQRANVGHVSGGIRSGAISATLGDRLYIGTGGYGNVGLLGNAGLTANLVDWWSYVPK